MLETELAQDVTLGNPLGTLAVVEYLSFTNTVCILPEESL